MTPPTPPSTPPPPKRLPIAISGCLLGLPVRYDGQDKSWPLIESLIASGVILLPFCPESESGLGVPREPMRLEGDPDHPMLLTIESRCDHTALLTEWSSERLDRLAESGVRGVICKARSPSCGLHAVPVCDAAGMPRGAGMGMFVRACRDRFPAMPIEEADQMADWPAVAAFLERCAW
ncbi:MAG: DUF523 domain-containing protein [Magnetococcus sp. YQC-9]